MTIRIIFGLYRSKIGTKLVLLMLGCALEIFNCSKVIDIDISLAKKPEINAAFLIINE